MNQIPRSYAIANTNILGVHIQKNGLITSNILDISATSARETCNFVVLSNSRYAPQKYMYKLALLRPC